MAAITYVVCNAGIVRAHCLVPCPHVMLAKVTIVLCASEELGDRGVTMSHQCVRATCALFRTAEQSLDFLVSWPLPHSSCMLPIPPPPRTPGLEHQPQHERTTWRPLLPGRV